MLRSLSFEPIRRAEKKNEPPAGFHFAQVEMLGAVGELSTKHSAEHSTMDVSLSLCPLLR